MATPERREEPGAEETFGDRVRRFREEAGMSPAQLATAARVSRSYLSELESGRGSAQKPSAEILYRLAKALGVAMSDLLGRPVITNPNRDRPPSLVAFAEAHNLPEADIAMLACIEFRGEKPKTPERWAFIYQAIRNSAGMDR
ncbi:MAG TPA: helix-turn-helix domain-containing protein [Gaiellaceae bacterium]